MKWLIGCLLIVTSLNCTELLKREGNGSHYFAKYAFDGHTYIHFRSTMNGADCGFLHDQDCVKCSEKSKNLDLSKLEERIKALEIITESEILLRE